MCLQRGNPVTLSVVLEDAKGSRTTTNVGEVLVNVRPPAGFGAVLPTSLRA